MSIKWAPILKVSLKRRVEVFSTFCFVAFLITGEAISLCAFVVLFLCGGFSGKLFCSAYLVHFYLDRKTAEQGGRKQPLQTTWSATLTKNFSNYFPLKLVKTAELPPDRNYILALFPHGVFSVSGFGNFALNRTSFQENFPNIHVRFCTLDFHFFIPFSRELFLLFDMISVQASSIRTILTEYGRDTNQFVSNAVVIAVGGSQEALFARPGDYQIVLKNRKGFIRMAIQTGASLVPVFSFGENDVYDQPINGTKIRWIQDAVKRLIGVSLPLVVGRGFFQYSFGIIPHRQPITTVVGEPLVVNKNPNPSDLEIDEIHKIFSDNLVKLFEDNKAKHSNNPHANLIIE